MKTFFSGNSDTPIKRAAREGMARVVQLAAASALLAMTACVGNRYCGSCGDDLAQNVISYAQGNGSGKECFSAQRRIVYYNLHGDSQLYNQIYSATGGRGCAASTHFTADLARARMASPPGDIDVSVAEATAARGLPQGRAACSLYLGRTGYSCE